MFKSALEAHLRMLTPKKNNKKKSDNGLQALKILSTVQWTFSKSAYFYPVFKEIILWMSHHFKSDLFIQLVDLLYKTDPKG